MNYYRHPKTGALIAHDVVTNEITELEPIGVHDPVAPKVIIASTGVGRGKYKRRTPEKKTKVDTEISEHYAHKGRHPKTEEIEKMLIAGSSVAEIIEKIEVSDPTVYLIRARLRKEMRMS